MSSAHDPHRPDATCRLAAADRGHDPRAAQGLRPLRRLRNKNSTTTTATAAISAMLTVSDIDLPPCRRARPAAIAPSAEIFSFDRPGNAIAIAKRAGSAISPMGVDLRGPPPG